MASPVVVVHGGCGAVRGAITPRVEEEALESLRESLRKSLTCLQDGGSATEAVKLANVVMEDCPWFNAGKGSVFTATGNHELDAGLMDGSTGTAGGVTYVSRIKNPILAADLVRTQTKHALIAGAGAEKLAEKHGLELVAPSYFSTAYRRGQLDKVLATSGLGAPVPALDHSVDVATKTGTVGAAALDSFGNLSCGSSTGGLTGKVDGRVSDSPIAGAGFFADENIGVSGTGFGDFFIRRSTCAILAERYRRMKEKLGVLTQQDFSDLCTEMVFKDMSDCAAGLVGVDVSGNVVMPFNTVGMFRGYFKVGMREPYVVIWKTDGLRGDVEIIG